MALEASQNGASQAPKGVRMTRIDRRNILALGLGATGSVVAAKGLGAQEFRSRGRPRGENDPHTMNLNTRIEDYRSRERGPRANPVLFWNDVSLQLVALDHSIPAEDARAPGPCAAARALALAHIVMADAVAAVYPVDFDGFYVRDKASARGFPDVFVGGAAAWILEYIYSTPAHSQFIGAQRLRFLDAYEQRALAAWEAGLAYARNELFTLNWDWPAIKAAVLATPTPYVPEPRRHHADPFNADQGFYGVNWGSFTPLDARFGDISELGPGPPPREGSAEYVRDFDEVMNLGAYEPGEPLSDQQKVGLFWAYDGARLIGPPPRLYNQFVRQIADSDGMSVPEMARLLALCNLAMADGGIVAWEAKYRYNIWRPVAAIRNAERGAGRDWRPLGSPRTNPSQFALGRDTQTRATAQNFLGAGEFGALPEPKSDALDYKLAAFTPNFPAFPSGHATFGSACFNMLKKVRAERADTRLDPARLDVFEDFVSDELNGLSIDNFRNQPRPYVPMTFTSIDDMIEDNNRSRVYLGVHWNFDCNRGAESGAKIAARIYDNAYRRGR